MLQRNQTYEKFTKKCQPLSKKKSYENVNEKTCDNLLAEHETRVQKFVRTTYEIVTCWLWTKIRRFYESS